MPPYKRKYKSKYKSKYKGKRTTKTASLSKQLMRMHESKYFPSTFVQGMLDDVYYQYSPTQAILPGNSANTRVGDSIYLQSLHCNGFFEGSNTALQTDKFRCLVFWSTTQLPAALPVGTFATNLVTSTNVFFPGTFTPHVPNAIVNPKAVTLLADFVVDINQQISGAKDIKSFNFVVPLNQTFNYRAAGAVDGKFKSLYVTFVSSTPGGTAGTTPCGYVNVATVLKFKDP